LKKEAAVAGGLLWFGLNEQASGGVGAESLASCPSCGAEPGLKPQALFGAASELQP